MQNKEYQSTLRSCPFCGGEAIKTKRPIIDEDVVTLEHEIICSWCGCRIARIDLEQYAIEAWNRRKPIDRIVEQLEEEKKQIEKSLFHIKYRDGFDGGISRAIEIVKGGAV